MKKPFIFLCFFLSMTAYASDYTMREVYNLIEQGITFEELKDLNLDLDVEGVNEYTALHIAARINDAPVVKRLLEFGANKKKEDVHGDIPLHSAADRSSLEAIKLLVDEETVNMKNNTRKTPLHEVSFYSRYEKLTKETIKNTIQSIQILIEKGADLNAHSDYNKIPLHKIAGEINSVDGARLLIDETIDINTIDREGKTPLYEAARAGNDQIVKLLLDEGADRYIKNKDGNTPLDQAKKNSTKGNKDGKNYKETIRLLENYFQKDKSDSKSKNPFIFGGGEAKELPQEEKTSSPKNKNLRTLTREDMKERGEVNFTSLITSSQKKKCEESVVSQSVKAKVPK